MPEVPSCPGSRWLRDDGFFHYGGHRFRETGDGTFVFKSRSSPEREYNVDIRTAPYCDCWPSLRRSPSVPCCHLNTLRAFLKRLKAEQPHTDQ